MSEKQRTISKAVTLAGKGLHSGKQVTVNILPAEENSGYRFKRIDIDGHPIINALAENVVSTARGTTLVQNGAEIMTIEHCLAALISSGIDNALVEVDGPEIPILDGSSKPFTDAFESISLVEQNAEREYFVVKDTMHYSDEKGADITIYPSSGFSIDTLIDFNSKVVGYQYATLKDLSEFKTEIAACKTFVFLHELEGLLAMNLIKGGDLDNALVIVEKKMGEEQLQNLARLFNKPEIKVLPEGYLSNTELSFQNEPARHKLLDIIGDFALVGKRIKGHIIARKPGHFSNTEFAKQIRKQILSV